MLGMEEWNLQPLTSLSFGCVIHSTSISSKIVKKPQYFCSSCRNSVFLPILSDSVTTREQNEEKNGES